MEKTLTGFGQRCTLPPSSEGYCGSSYRGAFSVTKKEKRYGRIKGFGNECETWLNACESGSLSCFHAGRICDGLKRRSDRTKMPEVCVHETSWFLPSFDRYTGLSGLVSCLAGQEP